MRVCVWRGCTRRTPTAGKSISVTQRNTFLKKLDNLWIIVSHSPCARFCFSPASAFVPSQTHTYTHKMNFETNERCCYELTGIFIVIRKNLFYEVQYLLRARRVIKVVIISVFGRCNYYYSIWQWLVISENYCKIQKFLMQVVSSARWIQSRDTIIFFLILINPVKNALAFYDFCTHSGSTPLSHSADPLSIMKTKND